MQQSPDVAMIHRGLEAFSVAYSARVGLLALALVAATAGCGAGTGPGVEIVMDTLPDGVVHVRNPTIPLLHRADFWQLAEVEQAGEPGGAGRGGLGDAPAVTVDGAGRVYLLDAGSGEIRVFDREGEPVRSFGRPDTSPLPPGVAEPFAVAADGGYWTVGTGGYRLVRLGPAGDTIRIVDRALGSATEPAVEDMFVDEAGYLWVVRPRPDRVGPSPARFDVFDADGRFLGVLSAGIDLRPLPGVVAGHLVGVQRDAAGGQRVVVYRINR